MTRALSRKVLPTLRGLVFLGAREVIARDRAPERVNVYEVMAKPALTVRSGMLARYAVRLLVRFRVSRALVVDDAGARPGHAARPDPGAGPGIAAGRVSVGLAGPAGPGRRRDGNRRR